MQNICMSCECPGAWPVSGLLPLCMQRYVWVLTSGHVANIASLTAIIRFSVSCCLQAPHLASNPAELLPLCINSAILRVDNQSGIVSFDLL
jgi:hypothetical protein